MQAVGVVINRIGAVAQARQLAEIGRKRRCVAACGAAQRHGRLYERGAIPFAQVDHQALRILFERGRHIGSADKVTRGRQCGIAHRLRCSIPDGLHAGLKGGHIFR